MKKILLFSLSLFIIFSALAQHSRISGSNSHSVMICENGSVFAWGENTEGQIGLSFNLAPYPAASYNTPQQVYGLPEIFFITSKNGGHNLGITCDDHVVAWGRGNYGQLGNGVAANSAAPVYVLKGPEVAALPGIGGSASDQLDGVTYVASGNDESFAILKTGHLVAWGQNDKGQLGNGLIAATQLTPTLVKTAAGTPLVNVIMVAAEDENGYALTEDGLVYSWGDATDNSGLALGRSIANNTYARPVEVQGGANLSNIVSITAGARHILTLDKEGYVWAWGGDWGHGQIGDGVNGGGYYTQPYATKVVAGELASTPDYWKTEYLGGPSNPVVSIAAGQAHSVAALADGSVVTWGSNGIFNCGAGCSTPSGQLGVGNRFTTYPSYSDADGANTAPLVGKKCDGTNLTGVVEVSAGEAWTFAMTIDGKIFVSGYNASGQLGIGSNTSMFCFTEFVFPACNIMPKCPTANWGTDVELCEGFSKTLSAGAVPQNFEVRWYKDNVLLETELVTDALKEVNYTVTEFGTYKVEIEDKRLPTNRPCVPCSFVSESINISLAPGSVYESTYCGEEAIFMVEEPGAYDWYTTPEGGTKLNSSNESEFFATSISSASELVPDSVYALWAENTDLFSETLIPENPCPSNNMYESGDFQPVMFTAYRDFTLESVNILQNNFSGSTINYQVELLSNNPTGAFYDGSMNDGPGTVINTSPTLMLPATQVSTARTIPVNFDIAGSEEGTKYWLRLKQGNYVSMLNCNGTFPYVSNDGVMEINKSLRLGNSSPSIGPFYNWQIESSAEPHQCGRIKAVVTKNCILTDMTNKEESNKIAISPNPFSSKLKVLGENIESIQLYGINGNLISEYQTNEVEVPSYLPNGIYLLKIRTDKTVFTEEILKAE